MPTAVPTPVPTPVPTTTPCPIAARVTDLDNAWFRAVIPMGSPSNSEYFMVLGVTQASDSAMYLLIAPWTHSDAEFAVKSVLVPLGAREDFSAIHFSLIPGKSQFAKAFYRGAYDGLRDTLVDARTLSAVNGVRVVPDDVMSSAVAGHRCIEYSTPLNDPFLHNSGIDGTTEPDFSWATGVESVFDGPLGTEPTFDDLMGPFGTDPVFDDLLGPFNTDPVFDDLLGADPVFGDRSELLSTVHGDTTIL